MDIERVQDPAAAGAGHVECWHRRVYTGRIVRHQGALWLVKSGWFKHPGARERDRLGYLLGREIVNVAPVEIPDPGQVEELRAIGVDLRPELPSDRVWLCRFVSTKEAPALPLQTLDDAMAGELVYSLWIRRRDAHAFNRAFVDGLPVFFDHETAFLGEPRLRDLLQFFAVGTDPGHAGLWRLDIGDHDVLDTRALRSMERARFEAGTAQPVLVPARSRDRFLSAADRTCDAIQSIRKRTLLRIVRDAGFDRRTAQEVCAFLLENQRRLGEHVAVLKRLLVAPLLASSTSNGGGP